MTRQKTGVTALMTRQKTGVTALMTHLGNAASVSLRQRKTLFASVVHTRIRLKLHQQLVLAFGLMIVLATLLAWVGWAQIKVIQHHFDQVVDRTLPTLEALAEVQERLQQVRIAELQHLTALTMPDKDREEVKAKAAVKTFEAALRHYLEVSAELGDPALIAQLRAKIAVFNKNRIKFLQMSYSAAGAEIERAEEAREYFNGEGLEAFLDADAAARELRALHTHQADQAKALGAAALASARQHLLAVGAAIVVLSLLLAAFITRRVTRQLGGEPDHVAAIAQRIADGDLYVPIPPKPPGDRSLMGVMGQMQTALREMVGELRETQVRLVAAARLAGMAEIAANVLHNVGNVLNSVNVSVDLVGTRLRSSRLAGLARAVQMIDEHAGDLGAFLAQDAKGRLLPTYLRELARALEADHAAVTEELGRLGKSVAHIKEVVATQQSYAGTPRMVEPVKLAELVDDALRMNAGAQPRNKVTIAPDVARLPALMLDRNRLLQILVNLVSNAKHALDGLAPPSPCITLGATLIDGRLLRITVADNGEGIAPENLIRIFAHGFTTRKNGNGFGLHSCVLAAQEMGGSLIARSDGVGLGATFTLDIPVVVQTPGVQ
jgi:signal transduction histidine kinase